MGASFLISEVGAIVAFAEENFKSEIMLLLLSLMS